MGKIDPREVAICTVHGTDFKRFYSREFERKYGWTFLQIQQLRRYTPEGYRVLAYGNGLAPEHESFLKSCQEVEFFSSKDHGKFWPPWPIRNWLSRQAAKKFKYIVHMDSDAFPIQGDWLERYCSQITPQCPVVAINRRDMSYLHTSFLAFTTEGFKKHYFDFSKVGVRDAGDGISEYIKEEGLQWKPLLRSNAYNYDPLIAGIFDDRIYHHIAGSRRPSKHYQYGQSPDEGVFRTKREARLHLRKMVKRSTLLHYFLMKQVFDNTDSFINQLRGIEKPLDVERAVRRLSLDYIQWKIDTRW